MTLHVSAPDSDAASNHMHSAPLGRLTRIALEAYIQDFSFQYFRLTATPTDEFLENFSHLTAELTFEQTTEVILKLPPEARVIWQKLFSAQPLTDFVQYCISEKGLSEVRVCGWLAALQTFEAECLCTLFRDHKPALPSIVRPQIRKAYRKLLDTATGLRKFEATPSSLSIAFTAVQSTIIRMLKDDTSLPLNVLYELRLRDVDIDDRTIRAHAPSDGQQSVLSISRSTAELIADFIPLRYRYLNSLSTDLWRSEKLLHS